MSLPRGSVLLHYALAAALQVWVLALRLSIGAPGPTTSGLVLFILPIVTSAYYGGLGPGLFSTALAGGLTGYFLLLPHDAATHIAPFQLLGWMMMILIGIVISIALYDLRRAISRAEGVDRTSAKILRVLQTRTTQSPNAIAMFDREMRYLAVSAPWREGYCLNGIEPVGAAFAEATPHFPDAWRDLYTTALAGNPYQANELEWRQGDGSVTWVSIALSPWIDGHGETGGIIISVDDVTARYRLDEQLRRARDIAEATDRAKSALLAGVSHELRTPLNGIIGFSEALLNGIFGPIDNERQRDYIGDIHKAGQHLLELINDILDTSALLARETRLNTQPLDMVEIVATAIRFVQPIADKAGVVLETDFAPELPPLQADERRILQVLLNLLSNAVKFTHQGGRVSVSVHQAEAGEFVIAVADTGVGMTAQELEMARLPFAPQQNSFVQSRKGAGLGLFLAEGLVAIHGGTLSIESESGVGTTVTLRFPQGQIAAPATA